MSGDENKWPTCNQWNAIKGMTLIWGLPSVYYGCWNILLYYLSHRVINFLKQSGERGGIRSFYRDYVVHISALVLCVDRMVSISRYFISKLQSNGLTWKSMTLIANFTIKIHFFKFRDWSSVKIFPKIVRYLPQFILQTSNVV